MSNQSRAGGLWSTVTAGLMLVTVVAGGAWWLGTNAETAGAEPYLIENALPQGAVLHVRLDGRTCVDEVGSLAISSLMDDEQMKEFMKPIVARLEKGGDKMLSELEDAIGLKMDEIRTLFSGSMTLTLRDFDMGDGSGPPDVDLIATVDLRDNPELLGKVAKLIAKGMKENMGAEAAIEELDGVKIWRSNVEGFEVMWATLGDYLVAGTNTKTLSEVFTRVKAKTKVSGLFASDDFNKCWNTVLPRGKGVMFMYMDMARVLEIAKASPLRDEAPIDEIATAIGLDSLRGIAYGISYEGGAVMERMQVSAPKGLTGVFAHYKRGDGMLPTLAMAPRGTWVYSGGRIDWSGLAESLVNAANDIDEDVAADVDEMLGEFEGEMGFSLLDDLLPCFGYEYAMWVGDSPFGGGIPEIILAMEVKDGKQAKLLGYMKKMIGEAGRVPSKTFKFKGRELTYFDTGRMGGRVDNWDIGLKPTVMFEGNHMLLAMAPQTLKNFVASRENQRASFADKADLKNGLGSLGPRAGHDILGYMDLGRLLTYLIDTGAPIAQSVAMPDDFPVDMTTFPTSDVFQKHLFGLTAVSTIEKDGMTAAMRSPMGYLSMIAGIGGGAAAVWMGIEQDAWAQADQPLIIEEIEIDEEPEEVGPPK